ncbi:MAG: hypothetical protein ACYC27_03660 [Armatimonadota bacterium]
MKYKKHAFWTMFIFIGVVFGILIGIGCGRTEGLITGLKTGLFYGVLHGAFYAVIQHIINEVVTSGIKDDTSPQQTRHIQVNMAYDEAFDLCKRSLQTLDNHRLDKADADNGCIKAWYGFPCNTYGENITFQLERNQDAKTDIILKSRPDYWMVVVDFGTSYKNIRRILNYMNTQAEVHVISS